MNRERHARIKELFLAACERPAGERGSFLDQVCGDDAELRRAVDDLLAADEEAPLERTDVAEYCITEGWVKVPAGKTVDRKGHPVMIKLKGKVEAFYR